LANAKDCAEGTTKHFLLDKAFNQCAETCLTAEQVNVFSAVEDTLRAATTSRPCAGLKYGRATGEVRTLEQGEHNVELELYAQKKHSEVWTPEFDAAAGIAPSSTDHLPYDILPNEALPQSFTWCDNNGTNYCTMNRNQHLPQYCGSCWAHGAISALGDRIKIARKSQEADINLSVQHVLNCFNVGSCHGGSVPGVYSHLRVMSLSGNGLGYETSNPYLACSSESREGFCGDADWSCSPMNVARTCSTFTANGGKCVALNAYPNVTISNYGSISGATAMQNEIYNRGPISCGIDASRILKYTTGINSMRGTGVDHVISVVGWGVEGTTQYWHVRNSWGEYWGEAGYIRVAMGHNYLDLESQCAWAEVKDFTDSSNQVHCYEDGSNC
jgi:cathepsin X